jgi:3-hydroxyisobutyrate dehydrogenase
MTNSATHRKRVAFIGLGNMGNPMARRLIAADLDLTVHDVDPDRARAFTDETGARWAATAAEAAADCDIAVLMLPNGRIVQQVILGGQGTPLHRAMHRGGLIIDMSSAHPDTYPPLLTEMADTGVTLVDAPVSGGVKGAQDGTLTIMAGGTSADIKRARVVLDLVGTTVFEMGPLGSGQAMKALNNLLSAGTLVLTVETLLLGKRFGLDPLLMNRVLNVSTGRNNSTDRKVEQFILSGNYASGFAHALMAKDVATALSLDMEDAIAPLSHLAGRIVNAAARQLEAAADHTEIARYLETVAKLPLSSARNADLSLPVPGNEDAG